MDGEEDVTEALVGEESQLGTKFRRRTSDVQIPHPPPKPKKITIREIFCREADAPCKCLNFEPLSTSVDPWMRLIGWVCRLLLPSLVLVGVGLLCAQIVPIWEQECDDSFQANFVICACLSFVVILVWILFFVEKIPKILRLRLLFIPFVGLVWSSYGFFLSTQAHPSEPKCSEIALVVLHQSLITFFTSAFPLVIAIVGFYAAIALMLVGALVSGVWAGVMTIATAACCCPCARKTYIERLGEPMACTWFGSCGKNCGLEFGMQTDMPCTTFNFEPLSARDDLWSRLGTWCLRCSLFTVAAGVIAYIGYQVHSEWLTTCEFPLRVQFCVAAPLYCVVLLAWDLFFVERIPKVLRMWCMVAAVAGLCLSSYGISIAQYELDYAPDGICSSSHLPVLVLGFNVALLLASLLPLIVAITGLYICIIVGLIMFIVSGCWASLMSLFTTACCCPCERRTMSERMQEPSSCEWFGKCGRDCTPVYGARGDDVPCACLNFDSFQAMQKNIFCIHPHVVAWLLRVVFIGASVSVVVYLALRTSSECEPTERIVFGISATLYVLILLGWQLFVVEKVLRLVRLWVIVLATVCLVWGSIGVDMSKDLHSCGEAALLQSIALILASLFPLIVLITGFYVFIVLGLFGFLISICYASACVCLSHCCPVTLASKRSFMRRTNEPLKCQWFNRCCGLCPPDKATREEMEAAANEAAARERESKEKQDKTAGLVAFLIPSLRSRPHPDCALRNFYTSPEWDRNLNTLIRDFLD